MIFQKNKFHSLLQKYIAFLVFAILIGFFSFTLIHLRKNSVYAAMQQELASHVVRFHVLAESDSEEDQRLKLLVKTAVLEYMEQPLARASSAEEALELLDRYTDDILRVASDVLAEQGSALPVTAKIERVYFPEKTYGDLTFPAGYYTAYRILLGSGNGQNWWCVLYPPLCFIDVTHCIVPEDSKEEIKSFLSEEEYALILADGSKEDPTYDNSIPNHYISTDSISINSIDTNSIEINSVDGTNLDADTIEIRFRFFDWLTSISSAP